MFETNFGPRRLVFSILATGLYALGSSCSANTLDVNLNGGANININNANNNKMTTPLKNFSPVTPPPGQIDLMPIATPPVTSTVTSFYGGWTNTDIVDPDYPNAAAAKSIRRSSGLYVGKLPETVPDGQPVKADDLDKFLNDYHKYLKDEGLESGSEQGTVINESLPVLHRAKKKSDLHAEQRDSVELLAKQQKLATERTASEALEKKTDAH